MRKPKDTDKVTLVRGSATAEVTVREIRERFEAEDGGVFSVVEFRNGWTLAVYRHPGSGSLDFSTSMRSPSGTTHLDHHLGSDGIAAICWALDR